MLDEMVVKATVKPTDCALTSQKHTSLPQVFDLGRKAINAAEIVQRRLAAVAVSKREFRTLRMMVPPIRRATIWIASPTDLSSVVLVVVKPRSRMMMVEKLLTTPFGMAAAKTETKTRTAFGSQNARMACFLSKPLFLMPVSLPDTRLTAMIFWR